MNNNLQDLADLINDKIKKYVDKCMKSVYDYIDLRLLEIENKEKRNDRH